MRLGSIFVWLGFYLVYPIRSCEWSFEGSCLCNRRHDMSRQDSLAINWKTNRTILSAWPRPPWSLRHHPCTSVLRLQENYQVIWSSWRTAGATAALAIHVHLLKISEIVYHVLTHYLSAVIQCSFLGLCISGNQRTVPYFYYGGSDVHPSHFKPIPMLVPKLVISPYITYIGVFIWVLVVSLFRFLLWGNDHLPYFNRRACRTRTLWSGPVVACTVAWAYHHREFLISLTGPFPRSLTVIPAGDLLLRLWLWLCLRQL